jgi:hypothetical protein
VIQPVLHIHVCANPARAESTVVAESAADPAPAVSAVAEPAAEPPHSVVDYAADYATAGAALTKTS